MDNNLSRCFDCDFRADSEKLKELLTSKVTKDCDFCEALKELDFIKERLEQEFNLNKSLSNDVLELTSLNQRLENKIEDLNLQVELKQEKINMIEQVLKEVINDFKQR